MTQDQFLRVIYGVAIILFSILIFRETYLILNIHGVPMVYGPNVSSSPTVHGSPNSYKLLDKGIPVYPSPALPSSGAAYWPNKSGSGGPSPSGGERKALMPLYTEVGWWNGDIQYPENVVREIYDNEELPERKAFSVGHWSSF